MPIVGLPKNYDEDISREPVNPSEKLEANAQYGKTRPDAINVSQFADRCEYVVERYANTANAAATELKLGLQSALAAFLGDVTGHD